MKEAMPSRVGSQAPNQGANPFDIQAYQELISSPGGVIEQIKQSGHPFVCLFHLVFKAIPVALFLLYWFLKTITGYTILNELIVLFSVLDFWWTKNITGRRLVKLRWWLDEDENQIERLRVECRVNQDEEGVQSKIFWGIQILYVLVTLVLVAFNVITIRVKMGLLAFCMFVEGAINLYCFIRCSKTQTERVQKLQSRLGLELTRKLFNGSLIAFT